VGRAGQETFDLVKNAVSLEVIQSDRIPVTDSVHNNIGLVYAPSETHQLA
jgi:hypothetical protein